MSKYFDNLEKDNHTRQISLKINAANHNELKKRSYNVSGLINRLVAEFLDQLPPT
jgi:hypothetical protein